MSELGNLYLDNFGINLLIIFIKTPKNIEFKLQRNQYS